jgi:hypothetical protein
MQNTNDTGFYSFRADANALGGILEKPFRIPVPTLAPVSLPAVGGFALAQSDGFTLHNIVSCRSAYTRVSGEENRNSDDDKTIAILVTSVVEGLNILEVVTAERIVAQLSILIPADRKVIKVSTAGSRFEGLRVEGQCKELQWNQKLQDYQTSRDARGLPLGATAEHIWEIGKEQAARVTRAFTGRHNAAWAEKRFEWMKRSDAEANASVMCSLVDGYVKEKPDEEFCGHVVDIPNFGRFFFGELLLTEQSAQLVSIRAELGCAVKGKITINCTGGGGLGNF